VNAEKLQQPSSVILRVEPLLVLTAHSHSQSPT